MRAARMIGAAFLIGGCLSAAATAADDGFETIFNGKDLTGWEGDPKYWSVEDGAITGTVVEPIDYNRFLIWRGGTVANFELKLKFRIVGGNSGINYRSRQLPDAGEFVVSGYQADLDAKGVHTGNLYEERGRTFLALRGQAVVVDATPSRHVVRSLGDPKTLIEGVDAGRWNEYHIVARGNHLTHALNGRTVVDVVDHDAAHRALEGLLAVQVHVGPPMVVQYKEVLLKRLPAGVLVTPDQTPIPPGAERIPIKMYVPRPGRSARAEAPRRPNVLFIAVDDLNDWVGCLGGHPQVKTPNIDRLARRGTLFTNAHCQAPLCNPSRSSLLTGLRPSTTGIYALQPGIRAVASLRDHVTLPQHFAAHGYSTFTAGKVFHDGSIPSRDREKEFQAWGSTAGMPLPPKKLVETPAPLRAMDWGVFPEEDGDQADWKIADSAIERLKASPSDRPFFVGVGFRLPHVPCFASREWFDLYPDASLAMPSVRDDDRDDVPEFAWYLHWKLPEPRLSWLKRAHQWRPLVRAYLASISFMDSQVGRVLDALEATGHSDDTVVVLWSDHGWHLGEKGITGKNTLWERSTRVPLIFAGPGVAEDARCAQPAELLDLYPTLAELCGLPAKEGLEGHSLVPQLKDAQAPRPWPALTTHNRGNHSVRSARWRYIRYADGSEELYDHGTDPDEWTNLAGDPRHAEVIREHARWLPEVEAPPVPGSAVRLLDRQDGVWYWEGKPIVPDELER